MGLRQLVEANVPKPRDVVEFEKALAGDPESKWGDFRRFLDRRREIVVVRAPARLDCMGGIADYCGSVVCEITLKDAVVLALQRREDRRVCIHSEGIEEEGLMPDCEMSLDDFFIGGKLKRYEDVAGLFKKDARTSWAAYIAGAFYVLLKEGKVEGFKRGANIVLASNIPTGAGIASSAAVEVAAMHAIATACNIPLEDLELARLAQVVENRVVGAPCGIMDQITAALGQEGKPFAIRCQPHEVLGSIDLAEDCYLVGINSKVKHSVAGSKYTDVRVGAFMGLTIILSYLRSKRTIKSDEDPFNGYLCNISPTEFNTAYRGVLPTAVSGEEFLRIYGETPDPVTRVDPKIEYKIRSRVEHPIYENARVQDFMRDLEVYRRTREPEFIRRAGRGMYASHWSYGYRCGLGSGETDLIVQLVREVGERGGLYGAKITGGGSGGTVAVLGAGEMTDSIESIAERYETATGIQPDIFGGSSPGALELGHLLYIITSD